MLKNNSNRCSTTKTLVVRLIKRYLVNYTNCRNDFVFITLSVKIDNCLLQQYFGDNTNYWQNTQSSLQLAATHKAEWPNGF